MPRPTRLTSILLLAILVSLSACTGSCGPRAELVRCSHGLCFTLHGKESAFHRLVVPTSRYSCARHGRNRFGLLLMHQYRREGRNSLLGYLLPLSTRAFVHFQVVDRDLNPVLGRLLSLHRDGRGSINPKVYPTRKGFLAVFTSHRGLHYGELDLASSKPVRKAAFRRFSGKGKLSAGFTYKDGLIYLATVDRPRHGGLLGAGRSRIEAVDKDTGRVLTKLEAKGALRWQSSPEQLFLRSQHGLHALLTRTTWSPYRGYDHLVHCPYGAAKCTRQKIDLGVKNTSGKLVLFRRKGGFYVLSLRGHGKSRQGIWEQEVGLPNRLVGKPRLVATMGGRLKVHLDQTGAGYQVQWYSAKLKKYRRFDSETRSVTLHEETRKGAPFAGDKPAPWRAECARILSTIRTK